MRGRVLSLCLQTSRVWEESGYVRQLLRLASVRMHVKFITSYMRTTTGRIKYACLRVCQQVGHMKLVGSCVVHRCGAVRARDHRDVAYDILRYLRG